SAAATAACQICRASRRRLSELSAWLDCLDILPGPGCWLTREVLVKPAGKFEDVEDHGGQP
ncbi:MAG: hypothetical protein ACKPHU_14010, partial [Planctomycetaceae bacterium]